MATCNDGGADGFRLGFAEQFTGAGLVVVIADRDPDLKGRRAAERRAAMIARFARDVRLVEFEDAKDVTDWFEQGHSLDELESIVSTATRVDDHGTPHMPGRSSTHDLEHLRLVSAASVNPEKVTFAWEDRIPIGMVSLLVGEGGLGKSLQMVTLAAGLTRGTIPGAFLGTPVRVAIATAEDHRASIVIPRLILAGADLSLIAFPELVVDGMADDIELTDQVEALEQLLQTVVCVCYSSTQSSPTCAVNVWTPTTRNTCAPSCDRWHVWRNAARSRCAGRCISIDATPRTYSRASLGLVGSAIWRDW